MIGWLKYSSPVSRFARSTLSNKGREVASSEPHGQGLPSPLVGNGAHRVDEGAFAEHHCPIWNDITRALEAK